MSELFTTNLQSAESPARQEALAKIDVEIKEITGELSAVEFAKQCKDFDVMRKLEKLVRKRTDILSGAELVGVSEITARTPEGKEVNFDLVKELEHWTEFYIKEGIDWIKMPDKLEITEDQEKEIIRLVEEVGLDKMIIIPKNLVADTDRSGSANTGEKYEKLHEKMTEGYEESYQDDNNSREFSEYREEI